MKRTYAIAATVYLTAVLVHGQVAITDFHNGSLTWTNGASNATCHVEWLPGLTGSNTWSHSWLQLRNVVQTNPTVTVQVPMFYRVVQTDEIEGPDLNGNWTYSGTFAASDGNIEAHVGTATATQRAAHAQVTLVGRWSSSETCNTGSETVSVDLAVSPDAITVLPRTIPVNGGACTARLSGYGEGDANRLVLHFDMESIDCSPAFSATGCLALVRSPESVPNLAGSWLYDGALEAPDGNIESHHGPCTVTQADTNATFSLNGRWHSSNTCNSGDDNMVFDVIVYPDRVEVVEQQIPLNGGECLGVMKGEGKLLGETLLIDVIVQSITCVPEFTVIMRMAFVR